MSPPPMSAVSERAPLRRASDDRLVLGVCAGIARSLELAPLAVRLFAVALAAVAAPLVLGLYVVLAAVMPRDDGRVLLGGSPADERETVLGWALIGFTLCWFAVEEFRLGDLVWPALSSFGVFAAAASALALLALAQRRDAAGSSPIVTPPPAPAPSPAAPRVDMVPAPPAEMATPATAIDGEAVTMQDTAVQPPPPPPPAPRPPRRGPSLGIIGFGVLLIAGAGIFLLVALGLVDLSARDAAVLLGSGAALAGAGAIAGAITRRRGVVSLIVLGIILGGTATGVALLETELDDGVGWRTERPLTVEDIPTTYRLGAGQLDVDLRDTELPPGPTTVRANIAAGELRVSVPEGVRVQSVGPTYVDGVQGVNADLAQGKLPKDKRRAKAERERRAKAEAQRPVVRIDADVRAGDAEVVRVGG